MSIRQQFDDAVIDLTNTKDIPPLKKRIQQVRDLTEWYYALTGKPYRNSYYLDLLGAYILADILRDKNVHKVKQEDYPILSDSQQKLRNRRESRVGDENIDFLVLKEVKNHPNAFKTTTQNKEE